MNLESYIVLAVLVFLLGLAVYKSIKNSKENSCSKCSACKVKIDTKKTVHKYL